MEGELTQEALDLDVDNEVEARALHRVVRAMHDGHCMECGYRAPAETFNQTLDLHTPSGYRCPSCGFSIAADEADDAMDAFHPTGLKSVAVFKNWAAKRKRRIACQKAASSASKDSVPAPTG